MQTPFDKIANNYDKLFTGTSIGKLQRNIVRKYLDETLQLDQQLDVLEFNCGTGEEAVYFAKKGFSVVATDSSHNMLKLTEEKIKKQELSSLCTTKKLDLNNPDDFYFDQKFDLVFSNFGGINCVNSDSLKNLNVILSQILKYNGRIIFIIMPRFCLWESFYFLLKIKPGEIFRRASGKPLNVPLNGGYVETFYYSSNEIRKIFSKNFRVKKIIPVGFFIPPSYLNNFFLKKKKTLKVLEKLENTAANFFLFSKASDHFLIDMELKG